jgi:hypothetical protein
VLNGTALSNILNKWIFISVYISLDKCRQWLINSLKCTLPHYFYLHILLMLHDKQYSVINNNNIHNMAVSVIQWNAQIKWGDRIRLPVGKLQTPPYLQSRVCHDLCIQQCGTEVLCKYCSNNCEIRKHIRTVSRQRLDKHVPAATHMHATMVK